MDEQITLADIHRTPDLITTSKDLLTGQRIIFRSLVQNDAQALGDYFEGLSDETKKRFGPHPLDKTTAGHLCERVNSANTLRMIATINADRSERVIAYVILLLGVTNAEQKRYEQIAMALDAQIDCTVAPSVADTFQNQGLGSVLMHHLIEVAQKLGRCRMVLLGGTQATNSRAIHFYHKLGFRTVGEFEHPLGCNNYDMLLEL